MTYFRFYPDCHYYPGPVKGTIYDISRNQIIWVKPHETYIINKFLKTTIESVIEEIGPDAKEVLDKLVNQGFGCVHNANVFTEKLYSKSNLNLGNLTMGHLNLQTVYLQLSDKCDRSCSFCPKASQYNWQGCNSCLKWPSNRLNTEIELPEFLPTLHEIICYKPKKLVFSGGNPLMVWEKLIQIIKIVRSQISNVSIQVNTNGVGLTNEMIVSAQ